jgi:CHAT domain-containing protein
MLEALARYLSASLLALSLAPTPAPLTQTGAPARQAVAASESTPRDPSAALEEGRRLLRRYQAASAYEKFKTALKLFTEAGNLLGVAAAQDALGDLHRLHGQQSTAFDYYRDAYQTFLKENDTQNADVVLAKLGEQYLLSGDTEKARAAFAAMSVARPAPSAGDSAAAPLQDEESAGGKRQRAVSGFAALTSLGSCLPLLAAGGNISEPPNEGAAPRVPDGKGRMDLRVTDETGNPIKGLVAQLQSLRPGGLSCQSWATTGALGRALTPPQRMLDTVKLVLNPPDAPAQELVLSSRELAQPVRVVVSKAGATLAKEASFLTLKSVAGAACFNSYRAFNAYAVSELGRASADVSDGRLSAARSRYESLLEQLALPGPENFKQTPRFRAVATTALGDIAFREGRLADAAAMYTQAVEGARKAGRLDLVWAAQRGLGRTAWQQASEGVDDARAARLRHASAEAYQSALTTVETIRAGSLRADEARIAFLATTRDVYDEAAAVFIKLAFLAEGRDPDAEAAQFTSSRASSLSLASTAFAITEQGRSRSLLDMLGETRAAITEGVPADLLQRRNEIVARQQEVAQSLMGVLLPGRQPPEAVFALEAELDRLAVEYDGLENTIRLRVPRYAALNGAKPVGLSEVRSEVLDAETALLLYSLGPEDSFLWLVTPKAVTITRLPRRALVEGQAMQLRAQLIPAQVRQPIFGIDVATEETRELTLDAGEAQASKDAGRAWKNAGQSSNAAAYAGAAYALYRTAVQPVAHQLADLRLLVVPDGALNFIPFEALVTAPPGDDADYSTLPYLIRTHEVAYAPSASVVNAVRRQAAQVRRAEAPGAQHAGGSLLVIADPVFSPSDARAAAVGGPGAVAGEGLRSLTLLGSVEDVSGEKKIPERPSIKRLFSTRAEANDIAQAAAAAHTPAEVWLDLDASETNLISRDMRRYRALHFATHGLLNAERPQFTGLVLSLVGETKGDGFLRVSEVFNYRLGAPLVMLSACDTGLGRARHGEGVIGLTRAFMYAGAPTVGVSLWAVADKSTALLMADFYKAFFANRMTRPGSALRAARLDMISNPRYSAPYYWAPFVLVGDWR